MVPRHYGIRTDRYKLIHYYGESDGATGAIDRATLPEWELFDLDKDPTEMENVYHNSEYAGIIPELKAELKKLLSINESTLGKKSFRMHLCVCLVRNF